MTTKNPDTPLTDKEWNSLGRPMRGVSELPKEAQQAIARSRGRPPSNNPKTTISIRLEEELVDKYRALGKGWQGRMRDALWKDIENRTDV